MLLSALEPTGGALPETRGPGIRYNTLLIKYLQRFVGPRASDAMLSPPQGPPFYRCRTTLWGRPQTVLTCVA
jgi:hypothetical protein